MLYYVDPYKKYYETLSTATGLSSDVSSMTGKVAEASSLASKASSTISSSTWSELGASELSSNVFPNLIEGIKVLGNNITDVLGALASKAIGELLPETEKLKKENENLENYQQQLNSLQPCSQINSDGTPNPNYSAYVRQKQDLQEKIDDSTKKCKEYVRNCNTIVNGIKSLDSKVADFKVSTVGGGGDDSNRIGEQVLNGKMVKMTIDGQEFYVPNTRINLLDYANYINKYSITQNGGVLNNGCPVLSQYYAMDLMRGTYTSRQDFINLKQGPSPRVNVTVESPNKDDVLKYIYDEAINGRVTTLQCTRYGGGRHIVTIVGFASSVKSYKDLNKDTILCLDNTTGRVSTLSKSGKAGRDLLAQQSSKTGQLCYLAHGATKEFIDSEVNNADWQAKHGQGRTTA